MSNASPARRPWVILQLAIAWLPVWALFALLIVTMHPLSTRSMAIAVGLRMTATAVVVAFGVQRVIGRVPWPRRMTVRFVAIHILGAIVYAVVWVAVNALLGGIAYGDHSPIGRPPVTGFLVVGIWLYAMIISVSYAQRSTERALGAETEAARARLAALRSQLNPHFLFNALHSVVQLIPIEPQRASQAAEQLGGLLRDVIEEDRELVPLGDERAFIERYLALERVRFGERLGVHVDIHEAVASTLVPAFALLTLVENAVRHGVEARIEPTHIEITGRLVGGRVALTVNDSAPSAAKQTVATITREGAGTGLERLRTQLAALYGDSARLDFDTSDSRGFSATLTLPRNEA